jgi:hypothetical protein
MPMTDANIKHAATVLRMPPNEPIVLDKAGNTPGGLVCPSDPDPNPRGRQFNDPLMVLSRYD